jgi:hypothetical protein
MAGEVQQVVVEAQSVGGGTLRFRVSCNIEVDRTTICKSPRPQRAQEAGIPILPSSGWLTKCSFETHRFSSLWVSRRPCVTRQLPPGYCQVDDQATGRSRNLLRLPNYGGRGAIPCGELGWWTVSRSFSFAAGMWAPIRLMVARNPARPGKRSI